MDSFLNMKILDLFSGIGGFSHAAHKIDPKLFETVAFCEIDSVARKVLNKNFPDVPIFNNIKTLKFCPDNLELYNTDDEAKVESTGHIDIICGGFPCFAKGTLVMTKEGYKPIQDLQIGEEVLTHKRRWRKINQKHETPNRQIRKIKNSGSFDIFTTDEHPFYSKTSIHVWDDKLRRQKLIISSPSWIKSKNLETRFIGHTFIPNKSNVYGHGKNEDYWWLIGRCLADGWVVNRKDRGNGGVARVVLCCGHHENIDAKINKVFPFSKVKERTTFKYHITQKHFAEEFHKAGRLSHNKFIPNDWLRLPITKLKALLDGYYSGDGSLSKNRLRASTVSKKLALTLAMAINKVYKKQPCLSFNKRPETCIIEGRIVNQRDTYTVDFSVVPDDYKKTFYQQNYGWSRCLSSELTNRLETVYNIGVDEDESYIADGVITHNCQDISVAGKQKGLVDEKGQETRSGLWNEYKRLIAEIKPKFVIIENVRQLLNNGFTTVLQDLNEIGYDCEWQVISAADIGANHKRERIWIIAYPSSFIDNKLVAIPNLNNYFIDKLGNIFSTVKSIFPKQIKTRITKNGYEQLVISINNKKEYYLVHRLMAKTFLKLDLENLEVNHKDLNKLNNQLSNLELITHQLNIHHSILNKNQKLPDITKHKIECITTGIIYDSIKNAALDLNVDSGDISKQINGKRSHVQGLEFKLLEVISERQEFSEKRTNDQGKNLYRERISSNQIQNTENVAYPSSQRQWGLQSRGGSGQEREEEMGTGRSCEKKSITAADSSRLQKQWITQRDFKKITKSPNNIEANVSNTDNFRFWPTFTTEKEKLKWWTEATSSFSDWWSPQPEFRGVFNGLSEWIYRNRGDINVEDCKNLCENLPNMSTRIYQKKIREEIRRFNSISITADMFSILWKLQNQPNTQNYVPSQSQEVDQRFLREVQYINKIGSTSYRQELEEQFGNEFNDFVSQLPYETSLEGWASFKSCTQSEQARKQRIKQLGNSIVPQIAEIIFTRIKQLYTR